MLMRDKSFALFKDSFRLICVRFKPYFLYNLLYQNQDNKNMQLTFQHAHTNVPSRTSSKSSSLNQSIDTLNSSTSSTQSVDHMNDNFFQNVAKWILSSVKKIRQETKYLALSYLKKLRKNQFILTVSNYQKIGVVLILVASKLNEIYPPKISEIVKTCKKSYTYEEIIGLQSYILKQLQFQVALDAYVYAFICRTLKDKREDKIEECEKLLRMACSRIEFYEYEEQKLGYAIMYLIIPDLIRSIRLQDLQKIKVLAVKIYSMYTDAKRRFDTLKSNRK